MNPRRYAPVEGCFCAVCQRLRYNARRAAAGPVRPGTTEWNVLLLANGIDPLFFEREVENEVA